MIGEEILPPNDEYRMILDAMIEGDDFTVTSHMISHVSLLQPAGHISLKFLR